jgi:hypothetical protein
MKKEADMFSITDVAPGGIKMFGVDMLKDQAHLLKVINQDKGLSMQKKNSLFTMLQSPEAFDNIMAGTAGLILTRMLSSYANMSPTARTLLSLAGFGMGNIIYNAVHERKYTEFDPATGRARIKL